MKRDDDFLKEMIEFYGIENLPDPTHYPLRFEFMTKSFEHYKRCKQSTELAKTND